MAGEACELTYEYEGLQLVAQCITCPAVTEIVAQPSITTVNPRLGWNSGARSVRRISGDCYVAFGVPTPVAGAICGLTTDFDTTSPEGVKFGIYVYAQAGLYKYVIVENGVTVTAPLTVGLVATTFRVERFVARVAYYVNAEQVYLSEQREAGGLIVVGLLYRADDSIE